MIGPWGSGWSDGYPLAQPDHTMAERKPKDVPETTRKALRDFLNSQEGAAFTLDKAKQAASQTKSRSVLCPNCRRRFDVEIEDGRAQIAALAFMHEYSVGKPEKDTEAVDSSKRLQDMTEAEREALRAQLYAKLEKNDE